jgi:hypothetical protein
VESKVATFHSKDVKPQLDVVLEKGEDDKDCLSVSFEKVKRPGMLGEGLVARIEIKEGQAVSFILRNDLQTHITTHITSSVLDGQQHDTQSFWYNFISQSKYKGRWREVVSRSLMILKMLTYGKPDHSPELSYLTLRQSPRVPSSPPQRSQYRKPSAARGTGTTGTPG